MLGRSSFSPSRSASFRPPEGLGPNALIMIANLCFSVFVIGVLIFTIIAVTYNPHEPFFHPSSKITNFLSSNSNPSFFNLTDLESELEEHRASVSLSLPENRDCEVDGPINCRDPEVFHLLMRAAIDKFKDVHFYRFGKPVGGDNDSSCHMAWRFRSKEEDVGRFHKDFRSFRVVRWDNCSLNVVGIGDYHSGGNARKRKGKGKDNNEVGEAVNDGLPTTRSEGSFSGGKYLVYSGGGGDRCKSMHQYLWSLTCMLGEAQFLNRTLVMDLSLCLSKIYSSLGVDEEGKDFRFYFDFEHLKDSASVMEHAQFWVKWQEKEEGLSLHLVEDVRVTPMKLGEVNKSLIMRKFGLDNYWYRVCEGEAEKVIRRPWDLIRKSPRLLDVAKGIGGRMNWDFDALHVERGEKARKKEMWPNLDRDTRPTALMAKLEDKIKDGRELYIATDEPQTSFFDPLKEKYSTHFLDQHKDLWDANSDWYYETTKLNNGNAVEFDGYMRILVDSEVFIGAKKQIETFNDLTTDCKDGINTC